MTKAARDKDARSAKYHDAHIDDPEEWDDSTAVDVTPEPSGVAILSLRLPAAELAAIKTEADARHTSVSELTRAALRSYLAPRATGTLAVSSVYRLQVSTQVPVWTGGFNDRRLDVRPDLPQPLAGNVEPTRQ
jgi:hypothetical protein